MNEFLEVRIPISPTEFFFNRIRIIALSIRSLGGVYENARFRVSVGADSDPEDLYIRCPWSKSLNIEWVWVKKEIFNKWKNTQNKYLSTIVDRFQPPYFAEYILVLDPDVLVMNRFDEIISMVKKNQGVAAVLAHRSPIAYESVIPPKKWWEDLYSLAGIDVMPSFECEHSGWGIMEFDPNRRMTPPYFNSGMVLGTASTFERFSDTYMDMVDIVKSFEDTYFFDQIGLTLALEKNKIRTHSLPLRYNFPNQNEFDEKFPLELQNVRFLHFLRTNVIDRDSDFESISSIKKLILRSDLQGSNEIFRKKIAEIFPLIAIQENDSFLSEHTMIINDKKSDSWKLLKNIFQFKKIKERKAAFNYCAYWDKHYSDMASASVINSQGVEETYKLALLESVMNEINPATTLDIGCGDMIIGVSLPDHGYTGVDVSPVVIKSNAAAFPKRRFICGDFLLLDVEKNDLVFCLGVLPHIPHRDDYLAFVSKCVKTTGVIGVVAAYEEPPATLSDITFYHEPISSTLRNAGATDIEQIGAYNQFRVFQFRVNGKATSDSRPLKKPIFLVGTNRSGTTMLADMLGSSPYVAHCSFELKDIWSHVGGVSMASPKTRDQYCPECFGETASQEMRERLIRAFGERISVLQGKSMDAIFLNKNPHLSNKLGLVKALFPDSRIIWTYRHLPQVVASIKALFADVYKRQNTRHWWPLSSPETRNRCWNAIHFDKGMEDIPVNRIFPGGDVYYIAEYWLETNRAIAEFFTKAYNSRCIRVEQERFIASPEMEMARIYGALQLPLFQIEHFHLDKKRNELWNEILDGSEHASLLRFVEERGDEIEEIFPGEMRTKLYLRNLGGTSH